MIGHVCSVKSFEFTSELAIFDLCGVELYHGWLPDPQDVEAYEAISCLSYNQLVEKSLEQSTSSTDIVQMHNSERCCPGFHLLSTVIVSHFV